ILALVLVAMRRPRSLPITSTVLASCRPARGWWSACSARLFPIWRGLTRIYSRAPTRSLSSRTDDRFVAWPLMVNARSRMLLVLGRPEAPGVSVLFAHVGARLGVPVIRVTAEVVNFRF